MNFTVEDNRGKEYLYLDLDFYEKDSAKKLYRGLRWSPGRKQWYCLADAGNVNIALDSREVKEYGVPRLSDLERLDPHQVDMVENIFRYRRYIIAGEMRTGKTLAVLTALANMPKDFNILYLAPVSGVKSVKQEIQKWGFDIPNLVLRNYESMQKVYDPYHPHQLHYDVIIMDEGHRLKSSKSNRGKIARTFYETGQVRANALRGNSEDFYLIVLSGTPAPKDPSDLWNIIEIVAPGFLPWGNETYMKQDLAVTQLTDYNGYPVLEVKEWLPRAVDKFYRNYVSQVMTTTLKKDVLTLPEKQTQIHRLRPTAEMKSALIFIRNICEDSNQLLRKTMQISDGFLYGDETITTQTNPKLDVVEEFLTSSKEDGRLVILAGFTKSVDLLVEKAIEMNWGVLRIDGRGYKTFNTPFSSDEALSQMDNSHSRLNRRRPLVVIGHPKSVATGLELSASKDIVYYSIVTDGEAMFQSVERAHSRNMRERLTIHYLFNLHTDEYLYKNNQNKKDLLSITLNGLKDAIDKDIQ